MNIILDTNVLLSAYLFSGLTSEVFDHIVINHRILISEWILTELTQKCRKKFQIPEVEIRYLINHLHRGSIIAKKPEGKIPAICKDKDDNNILHLVLTNSVDLIVTGDSDLLEIKMFEKTKIISPRQYKIDYMKSY